MVKTITNETDVTPKQLDNSGSDNVGGALRGNNLVVPGSIGEKTGATGTVAHDFAAESAWYHTAMAGNFVANITNVPTTGGRALAVTLVLVQGATARACTGVAIDGVAQTVRWEGGSASTGGPANTWDMVNLSLVRVGASWVVFGHVLNLG